jgi:hypothetical protein
MGDAPTHRSRARAAFSSSVLGVVIAAAACGGAVGQGPSPAGTPTAASSATATATATAPTTAPATATTTATPTSFPVFPTPPLPQLNAPRPPARLPDLQALGLDASHLPPIEKLEPKTLRGVMKLMAKSLGIKCGDCHKEGDFAAPTRRKKIAARMWDEFAAKLAFAAPDGAPLFCDSCHQGRVEQLDRRDKKALSKWMDDNFVAKLKQKNGGSQECETCHVDMEMQFLALWGR